MTNEQFENLKWIQSLTKLHYLNLTGNELTEFPSVKLAVSELNLNGNKISMVDFDILANENLNNLQHLDISDNPLKGFKSLNNCPNHSLTININTLKNFTILEELETSQCFKNGSHFPAVKIDLTEREAEEPIACDHWCNFNDIIKRNIIIDAPCNCTEETDADEDVQSTTSSGADTGT